MHWTWTDWGDCGAARCGELTLLVTWARKIEATWRLGAVDLGKADWGEA